MTIATMRTTPRNEGDARRTDGGTTATSSGPASGGRSMVWSVCVIARSRRPRFAGWSGRSTARPSRGSRAVLRRTAPVRSGRRGRDVRVVGLVGALGAVGARVAPGHVDVVGQALDLEGEDDPHHADRDGPDPADGDDGDERRAGVG